jgi:hypothetical protein
MAGIHFLNGPKDLFTQKGKPCQIQVELSQCIDVPRQTTFQVGCFVAVDVTPFCQTVDHADHLRQKRLRFCLVFEIAQIFDCSTSRFFVVTVL